MVRKVLLGSEIAAGDEVIKLEGETTVDVIKYVRGAMVYLLEALPGQVKLEGETHGNDEPAVDGGIAQLTKEDFQALWAEPV